MIQQNRPIEVMTALVKNISRKLSRVQIAEIPIFANLEAFSRLEAFIEYLVMKYLDHEIAGGHFALRCVDD